MYAISRLVLALLIASAVYLRGELASARAQQAAHAHQAALIEEAGIPVPILKQMSRDSSRSAEWTQKALHSVFLTLSVVLLIAIWSVWEMTADPYYRAEVLARWIAPLLLLAVFDSSNPLIGWLLVFVTCVVEASVRLAIRKVSQQSGYGTSAENLVGWDVIVVLSGVVLAFAGAAMNASSPLLFHFSLWIVVVTSLLAAIQHVSLLMMGLSLGSSISK